MTLSVSAPGKAFLIGEYAVLEGAPAIVTAVDVRAIAHRNPMPAASSSAVVSCAHARVSHYLEGKGADEIGPAPVVETGGFAMGPRKLGLGSSAAVAASVVGYHLAEAGLDPSSPAISEDALNLALAAHAEAQGGGGSGADVAAAVLGGTLRFQLHASEGLSRQKHAVEGIATGTGRATALPVPSWLRVGFVDAGAPAITSSFVRRVKAGAQRHPLAYREAIGMLDEASAAFLRTFAAGSAGNLADLVAACRRHNEGLRALATLSEAPIMTPALEHIVELATRAGLAAKPSGAGGGDLVAVFADSQPDLDRFAESIAREHGCVMLSALGIGAAGLRAEDRVPTNSRLQGFFKLSVEERRMAVARATGLDAARLCDFDAGALDVHRANHMIENVVGTLELPLAIATNFRINGRDHLVPMAVEEASVVAAASNAARMIRAGGGFSAHSDPPWMIAQVQLTAAGAPEPASDVLARLQEARGELLALADSAHPRLVERGGGARELELRALAEDMVVVHVLVDCKDAMGANLLNTVAETLAPRLEALTGWTAGLRILSNLADRRCAHVRARVPPEVLVARDFDGASVVDGIVSASRFAELDPYRAATHNKGIMNGVDAVVLATGNDWRAMEASAHAYAARDGRYKPLAVWRKGEDGWLEGQMSLPAAVGVVGGATRVHPVCALAIEILGIATGTELGQVMAAAGLASNLAALRALATEGIQRGHMSLHARNVALGAGATGPEVEKLARRLIEVGEVKSDKAVSLLEELRKSR